MSRRTIGLSVMVGCLLLAWIFRYDYHVEAESRCRIDRWTGRQVVGIPLAESHKDTEPLTVAYLHSHGQWTVAGSNLWNTVVANGTKPDELTGKERGVLGLFMIADGHARYEELADIIRQDINIECARIIREAAQEAKAKTAAEAQAPHPLEVLLTRIYCGVLLLAGLGMMASIMLDFRHHPVRPTPPHPPSSP